MMTSRRFTIHSLYLTLVASLLCVVLIGLTGCGASRGKALEFNGGELYYTKAVTEAEARKLGDYLVEGKFFDGTKKSAQLNKEGAAYEFRVVVKDGAEKDEQNAVLFQQIAQELSQNVFGGAAVNVHLCDAQLKTLRVITAQ
ncbi:MAG: hypothetical protein IAF08_16075 [Rhizobacter sp.]|nr:hypothetical protein [Chlorobiales bacterium]